MKNFDKVNAVNEAMQTKPYEGKVMNTMIYVVDNNKHVGVYPATQIVLQVSQDSEKRMRELLGSDPSTQGFLQSCERDKGLLRFHFNASLPFYPDEAPGDVIAALNGLFALRLANKSSLRECRELMPLVRDMHVGPLEALTTAAPGFEPN